MPWKGLSTINARAEAITKPRTWREPMRKRRCIISTKTFYEWEKAGMPSKQPYAFELANGNPLGFAGLWGTWKDKADTGFSRLPSSLLRLLS